MNIKSKILLSIILISLSQSVIANQDINSTISKSKTGKLFSINKKIYTIKDFPKEYQEFSEEEQKRFISRYLYYYIFLNTIKDEQKKYKNLIQDALKKRDKELKIKGISLNKLQQELSDKRVIVETVALNEVLKKHKDINKEIEKFYKKNRDGYKFPNMVEVSHIVTKDLNISNKLKKRLKENNDSISLFTKLVKEYSLDRKSKESGGYVGNIGEKELGKDFFDYVWKTEEHHIVSKILPQNNYYHLLYVLKKYKARQHTLEEERNSIQKYLLKKEINEWKYNKYHQGKKNTKVEFYDIQL